MSGKQRIKAFLRANQGRVVTTDELIRVSGISSAARRTRELRDHEGWPIRTRTDDSTLGQNEYRLDGEPPADGTYTFSPRISARKRAAVLERNGATCQLCGAMAGDPDPINPRRTVRLHIGHIEDRAIEGDEDMANLRAECSACNQGRRNLAPAPPRRAWLLGQVRAARVDDQQAVLDWLERKFHG